EILIRRRALEPALSPCAERAHQHRQFLPRFGQLVFGAMETVRPGERPDENESLEPLGENGAGHPGDSPADVVEAAAAAQDFPHDQEGPAAAQHFVGARDRAELSVPGHAGCYHGALNRAVRILDRPYLPASRATTGAKASM